ncbi:MAG: hypothetical protein FD146_60 [Anaerolineaceae bacterium]|nr:MAG: hypothetical protein FD146_60 [Anaerolineaceae bacterium]
MYSEQCSVNGKLRQTLENGEISLQGQFILGSNYTFLVTVHHAGQEIPAVYKPMRGERPLWDFPEASLAGREAAAYLVSQALGWGLVPLTVLRDGPLGPGSLQQFIEYDPNVHYFTFPPADRLRLRPVALFDLLVNNADRKGSHVLFEKRTRRLFAIDHGLCFHAEDKLRTVIWDFAGEAVPPELLAALETFRGALDLGLPAALQPYLQPDEIAALHARAGALLANPIFPHPPEDRRSFPYPPL